ncbi:hypothetical protein [uncultured Desulfosarcina sp.]|uniref:hypothetical protein n=1 Tax=uncultured Desulfosarcina sp. TaxID=218289 RepID=UPI0029C7EA5A|nr:hypothetical protein [uncultured Desulfosarcina sp.]
MPKFKEMPYKEKYEKALEGIEFMKSMVQPFIKMHLTDNAIKELQKTWDEGLKPIPEAGSFKEKYETAYSNYIWVDKSAYNFIRKEIGKDGIEKFKNVEIEGLKQKNAGPATTFLGMVRRIAPGYAFLMTSKEFSYQLQWLTPFTVSEMNKQKTVFDIPRCKILDFKKTGELSRIGCQSIYPTWAADQFKVKMTSERNGRSCKCILTPIA